MFNHMHNKFKSITKFILLFSIILSSSFLYNCSSKNDSTDNSNTTIPTDIDTSKLPLNLSIYIDLSDRVIKNNGAVPQLENDTALINYIFEQFVNRCKTNILENKDHFQILFYPQPSQSNINSIAKSLNLDLSKIEITGKKNAVKNFQASYKQNLSTIYNLSIESKKFIGSDIWGFFSDKKVDQICMRDGYRNIIIILTDGYIFHAENKIKDGNAYSYVLPQTLSNPSSSLIVKRNGLENLEVLLLELNPYELNEYDRMHKVISDWFNAMGVNKISINKTDIEANTEAIIENFLK